MTLTLTSLYLQDPTSGRVLDKWTIATRDEEQVILQQFLRFGETKSIAQEIILSDTRDSRERAPSIPSTTTVKNDSEIKKFIERSNLSIQQSYLRSYGATAAALLSRGAAFPGAGAGGAVTTTASAAASSSASPRMLSPTAVMQAAYSPGSGGGGREALAALQQHSPTPITSSPLTRLQGMQPFDYRSAAHASPLASPGASDKSIPPSLLGSSKSPENLSLATSTSTSPGASTGMSLNTTPISTPKTETPEDLRGGVGGGGAISDDDSSDGGGGGGGVINYSTKTHHHHHHALQPPHPALQAADLSQHPAMLSSSVFADKKIKHLRKSSNPMKRQWQPNPTFGQSFVSPSGKKRVLCTACNKTFCDKGALKIHYSAVHLKEMHKCTVEGCNMMFSSRRSRNRHSANPNPKLHMPTNKRKYPEGASLADESKPLPSPPAMPVLPSSTAALPSQVPPGMHMAHMPPTLPVMPIEIKPMDSPSADEKELQAGLEKRYYMAQAAAAAAAVAQMGGLEPTPGKIQKLDFDLDPHDDDATDLSRATEARVEPTAPTPSVAPPPPSNGGSGRRKRKSNVPTRCAQMEDLFISDENSMEHHDTGMLPQDLSFKPASDRDSSGMEEDGNRSEDAAMLDDMRAEDDAASNQSKHASDSEDAVNDAMAVAPSNSFHEIRANAIKHMDSISKATLRDAGVSDDASGATSGLTNGPVDPEPEVGRNLDDDSGTPNISTPNTSISSVSSLNSGGDASDDADSDVDAALSQDDMANNNDNDLGEDIPLDKDNPKKCSVCGRIFQNHFSLKTHFQNVHLKLMHTCNVEGCNAAFPSKRSRDRHSANLNLHRKLLSTSSTEGDSKISTRSNNSNSNGNSLRDEFLPRIYDNQNFNGNVALPRYEPDDDGATTTREDGVAPDDQQPANGNKGQTPLTNGAPGSPPPSPASPGEEDKLNGEAEAPATEENECPKPDKDGMVKCHVCTQKFRDNLHLKEHFEKVHPKEMFHCTIKGCDKIFSTRKSRNRHSQNDNLHRHLSPTRIN